MHSSVALVHTCLLSGFTLSFIILRTGVINDTPCFLLNASTVSEVFALLEVFNETLVETDDDNDADIATGESGLAC